MSRVRPTKPVSVFYLIILLCLAAPLQKLHAQEDEYTTHIVKWYEDLNSIASTYGISAELIAEYNSLKDTRLERRQVLRIPKYPEKVRLKAREAADVKDDAPVTTEQDRTGDRPRHIMPAIPLESAGRHISIALSLPLHSNGKVNDSNYDFYSGALLAVRDLSDSGTAVDLHIFDTSEGLAGGWQINECQLCIGPLGLADMDTTLRRSGSSHTAFVSPLDSRTAILADKDCRFIQAPGSIGSQNDDVILWLREDLRPRDKVLVISESGSRPSAILSAISSSGIPFTSFSYDILEGRDVEPKLSSLMTTDGTNRIIIASDREAFVNDAVRNLGLAIHTKHEVILYSNSRIRSFETIDAESLHDVRLHVCTSYYIDYDAPEVRGFLMAYRAVFGAEPGPFAFQGYDTVHYFASLIRDYGENWSDAICGSRGHAMQSDFLFKKSQGYLNVAARRLIYDSEYRINYLKQN